MKKEAVPAKKTAKSLKKPPKTAPAAKKPTVKTKPAAPKAAAKSKTAAKPAPALPAAPPPGPETHPPEKNEHKRRPLIIFPK